jgi:hypothetical protein
MVEIKWKVPRVNSLLCFPISCTMNSSVHSFVFPPFAHKLQSYSCLFIALFQTGPKDVLSNITVEATLEDDYRVRMGFVVKTCPLANSSVTLWNYEFIGYMLMLRSLDNYGSST